MKLCAFVTGFGLVFGLHFLSGFGLKAVYGSCSPWECPPNVAGFSCSLHCLVPNNGGTPGCNQSPCNTQCGPNCKRTCPRSAACGGNYVESCQGGACSTGGSGGSVPVPQCTSNANCACNGNCKDGVCTSGCGGPGLIYQYVWVNRSSGSVASNDLSCTNFWREYGLTFNASCISSLPGLPCDASFTPTCVETQCGGIRCQFTKDSSYRMTVGIVDPPGYSLGRADWWTESQSGNGRSATFNVTDGGNFTFVPYFNLVKSDTRTILEISNNGRNGWTTGTLDSSPTKNCVPDSNNIPTQYCVYFRTRVLDNSNGIMLGSNDTDRHIDLQRVFQGNSNFIFDDIDDSNMPYAKIVSNWQNGQYRFRSFYEGTNYWAESTSSFVRYNLNLPVCVPPAAPTLLSPADGANFSTSTVRLEWRAVPGATDYTVFVGENNSIPSALSPNVNVTSLDYTVNSGSSYTWYVIANNGAGCQGPQSLTRSFNAPNACPDISINNIVVNISGGLASQIKIQAKQGLNVMGETAQFDPNGPVPSLTVPATGTYQLSVDGLPAECTSNPASLGVSIPNNACGAPGGVFEINCIDPRDYFQVFGGGVTAAGGNVANPAILNAVNKYTLNKSTGGPIDADAGIGIASGSLTPPNRISEEDPWILNSYEYNREKVESGLSFETLKNNILRNAGVADIATGCNGGGNPKYRFVCYGLGDSLSEKIQTPPGPASYVLVVPSQGTSGEMTLSATNLGSSGNKVILLVEGNLTIEGDIRKSGQSGGIVVIVKGDLNVNGGVNQLDGVYIFNGKFDDNKNNVPSINGLSGKGMIYGVGENADIGSGLKRDDDTNLNTVMEDFTYQSNYLDFFKNVLVRPKVSWTELSPR